MILSKELLLYYLESVSEEDPERVEKVQKEIEAKRVRQMEGAPTELVRTKEEWADILADEPSTAELIDGVEYVLSMEILV
jgi:uncharacterized protein (DUF1697 family)